MRYCRRGDRAENVGIKKIDKALKSMWIWATNKFTDNLFDFDLMSLRFFPSLLSKRAMSSLTPVRKYLSIRPTALVFL
jgi:hypothetical protein